MTEDSKGSYSIISSSHWHDYVLSKSTTFLETLHTAVSSIPGAAPARSCPGLQVTSHTGNPLYTQLEQALDTLPLRFSLTTTIFEVSAAAQADTTVL
jgi:hypothetical protein